MSRRRFLAAGLALVLAVLASVTAPSGAAPTEELTKLKVLIALDTNSNLKPQLEVDEGRFRQTLEMNIPAARMEITTFKANKVTRDAILGHYKNLAVTPKDALLFFYGGHGATDPKTKRLYFQLQEGKGKPLFRRDLLKVMEDKKPGLVVMLTDCCSTPVKMPFTPRKIWGVKNRPASPTPLFRDLFFRSRGTASITAATGNASWGDDDRGGIFTRSLCWMLRKQPSELDKNKDGFVSWREFAPRLQADTQDLFKQWSKDMRARGEKIDATDQKPQILALPPEKPAVAKGNPPNGKGGKGAKVFAVVSIENKKPVEARYSWRWRGQGNWNNATLKPGEQTFHKTEVSGANADLPFLEVRLEGSTKPPYKCKPNRFSENRQPGFKDGWKYYLRPKE
jgi:hypothetical protein